MQAARPFILFISWQTNPTNVGAQPETVKLYNGNSPIFQVSTSFLSFRFRPLRRWLQGEPVVLVREGEIIRRNLRRERIDEADIAEKARLEGIESMEDIRWAVLETNGEISFIKRSGS